jgi:hypothetical protein
MIFATKKVGKSIRANKSRPKNRAGPKWKGVKGIISQRIVGQRNKYLVSYSSP